MSEKLQNPHGSVRLDVKNKSLPSRKNAMHLRLCCSLYTNIYSYIFYVREIVSLSQYPSFIGFICVGT